MAATINRIQSALCHAAVAKSDDCHLMPQHTTLCVIKNDLFNKYSEMLAELTEDGSLRRNARCNSSQPLPGE
ncbi:hypothetical protein PInf_017417 [Phytophthora infestans]|nr:hypothetical protein PInf_017417 [Phytophthora infestans]